MSGPDRILLIRPSALGDVCRTVPVAVSLRRAFPEAEIDWLAQEEFVPAVACHPAVTEVVPFPRSRFATAWRGLAAARELERWVRRLRRRRYDLVLDCQGLSRSGLIARATGARRRVGARSARELAWLWYTHRHDVSSHRHTVDRMLALAEAEGAPPVPDMRLYVAPADRAWWERRRAHLGVGPRYAVLAPTSRWASKRWCIERWAGLVKPLRRRGIDRAVLLGAPSEVGQIEPLSLYLEAAGTAAHVVDLVGKATVGQTMAIIERADLVIANDSAPLHMAVGFDRPCVALFGPTDPAAVGPYRREQSVIRRYVPDPERPINFRSAQIGDALMRLIEIRDVVEKVDQVLAPSDATEPTPGPPAPTAHAAMP